MRCPIESDKPEILLDYCARTLDSDESVMVEAHIEKCEVCSRFCAAQTEMWNALDSWQNVAVSEDFDRRLYARIAAEEQTPWWSRMAAWMRPLMTRPAIPLSAAACMLVVGGILLNREGPSPAPTPVAVQVEQVERTLDDLEMLKDLDLLDDDGGGSQTM